MGQQIVYCSVCQTRLLGHDIEQGKAVEAEGRYYCRTCAPQAPDPEPPAELPKPSTRARKHQSDTALNASATWRAKKKKKSSSFTNAGPLSKSSSRMRAPSANTASGTWRAPPPEKSGSAGILIAVGAGVLLLIIIIVAVATSGSSTSRPMPPPPKPPSVGKPPPPKPPKEVQVDPARVDHALEQIRDLRKHDVLYRRRAEVVNLYRATADMAGSRRAEIERMLADYEKEVVETADLIKGLEGWYRFVDTEKLGFDYSVNRDDTKEIQGASWKGDGPGGRGAIAFNGNGSMAIAHRARDSFTLACWVRTTTPGPDGPHWWSGLGLIDGEVDGGDSDDFGLSLMQQNAAFGVGNPDTTLRGGAVITDGSWHHVAATREGRSGRMALYVDGKLQGQKDGPVNPRNGPTRLMLGRLQSGKNPFTGELSDVRIYARALKPEEVAKLVSKR